MNRRESIKATAIGILFGLLFVSLTSWLFYDLEPVSLLLVLVIPLFVRRFRKKKREQRMQTLDIQFKDALQYLRNGLDAGYSPEHSLKDAAKGLESLYGKNAEITKGFDEMAGKLSTGMNMEQAFFEFAESTGVERIREFAGLFGILKRTGGNLNRVIRGTVVNLTDSINLRRDLNVVIAAKRGEFNIMCAIPYGILLYLKLLAPEMSAPLYHSSFGILFMSVILLLCMLCFYLGQRVIERTLRV
jgi:tight adherence protein B